MQSEPDKNIPEKPLFSTSVFTDFYWRFQPLVSFFSYYLSAFSAFFAGPPDKLADMSDIYLFRVGKLHSFPEY